MAHKIFYRVYDSGVLTYSGYSEDEAYGNLDISNPAHKLEEEPVGHVSGDCFSANNVVALAKTWKFNSSDVITLNSHEEFPRYTLSKNIFEAFYAFGFHYMVYKEADGTMMLGIETHDDDLPHHSFRIKDGQVVAFFAYGSACVVDEGSLNLS